MCGLVGFIDFNRSTPPNVISSMVDTLHHRGPDDKGFDRYYSSGAFVALGHTRLAIIDVTNLAHQPMHYKELTIVFNGEIYNYKEIRKDLENIGHKFISNSDTEVLLHSYECWGTEFVNRLIGMYVIVIYDKNNEKLFIFRDRAGVKPLYYYWHKGLFLFASELKSFHSHPEFKRIIDKNAASLFFDFGYIPAPHSIFLNTFKLEAGKFITTDIKLKRVIVDRYWSIDDYYLRPKFKITYNDAKEQVKNLLVSSCKYRMIADVPIGIFLSGGYDSSTVAAILQRDKTDKIKTYTIGFEDANSEIPFAREIARYLGTNHTEFICTTNEAQSIIKELPFCFDEPFADSSAIPTYLVSKIAQNDVKVALSADGGDELFIGYDQYLKFYHYLNILKYIPRNSKSIMQPALALLSWMIPKSQLEYKHKLRSISLSLNVNDNRQASELYRLSATLPNLIKSQLFAETSNNCYTKYDHDFSNFNSPIEIALAIDYEMYLQNDILTKVDRASMAVSLEGREPLLDHRLTEFVVQLPTEYKFMKDKSKRILKDIAHDLMPKELIERPKMGFSLPISKWLQGDLKYLIKDYLNPKAIGESGLFNSSFTTRQVELFQLDKYYYKTLIWKILMFQMWYFRWMRG